MNNIIIHFVWFNIPLSQSLTWNCSRDQRIPEKAIASQYLRIEPPQPHEYDILEILKYNPETNTLQVAEINGLQIIR